MPVLLVPGTVTTATSSVLAAATALPTTGGTIPFLAAGVAIGIALLLRAGRSKLDDSDDPNDGD